MTNADKFWNLFGGVMATEIWALPEDDFLEWLNSEATANAVQAKTGLWLVNKDRWGRYYATCSCCGFKQYAGITNYCPDCGAKLKEKVNDETD